MKWIFCIPLFFILNCFAQDVNKLNKAGEKQGSWTGYYENSYSKRYQGTFDNGKPTGRFTYYALEGHVNSIVDFINDSISDVQMFHDNGTIMAEGKYLNKLKTGKWFIYSRNDYLLNIFTYHKGALEGTQYTYHPKFDDYEKLKVMEQYECKGGLKHGLWKEFNKLGRVKSEGYFVDGAKEGVFTYYFSNGSIEMKGPFKNDVKNGDWFFYNGETSNMDKLTYVNGEVYEPKDDK